MSERSIETERIVAPTEEGDLKTPEVSDKDIIIANTEKQILDIIESAEIVNELKFEVVDTVKETFEKCREHDRLQVISIIDSIREIQRGFNLSHKTNYEIPLNEVRDILWEAGESLQECQIETNRSN
ncbi:MAG: hypothetical protein PHW75_00040 [Patescibacteria group bacterium]|nr:hypothetical protein [Patescibacteria group bacterium]